MEEKASRRNNLPLLLLHLSATSTGGVGRQVARSSRRSLDPTRFVSSGRRLAPSWVAILSATIVVFAVLQLGVWMTAGGGVPLLRLHRMKLMMSGSGDRGEDPRPTCHKVSVSLLATVRFIGSKSIFVCEGALPDLGMANSHLFFRRSHGGGRGRWWTTF
jgi:hypothetical protein